MAVDGEPTDRRDGPGTVPSNNSNGRLRLLLETRIVVGMQRVAFHETGLDRCMSAVSETDRKSEGVWRDHARDAVVAADCRESSVRKRPRHDRLVRRSKPGGSHLSGERFRGIYLQSPVTIVRVLSDFPGSYEATLMTRAPVATGNYEFSSTPPALSTRMTRGRLPAIRSMASKKACSCPSSGDSNPSTTIADDSDHV